MSLSALARSPECEQLLKFVLEHNVTDTWEHPRMLCYVNGRVLAGETSVGEADTEMVVHIAHSHLDSCCSIHLSTLLALATAYVKYQYDAVAEAIIRQGQPVDWALKDKPEGTEGRVMVYANLVARYGVDSPEAMAFYKKYANDLSFSDRNEFVEQAASVRLKALVITIITKEQEAKIQQQRQNASDQFLEDAGLGPSKPERPEIELIRDDQTRVKKRKK